MSALLQAAVWLTALVFALMAGVYFAFSTFIMAALARATGSSGIDVMQSVNIVIVRSPFIAMFFASTLAAFALAIAGARELGHPYGLALAAGGAVYVVGMFMVTAVFNVPLNNELAALDPCATETSHIWPEYLSRWTAWNHVRTGACMVASALFAFSAAQLS